MLHNIVGINAMLLLSRQWVFLQGKKDSIFVTNFAIAKDSYREDHLLLCLNVTLSIL